jgi:hypothetical protein
METFIIIFASIAFIFMAFIFFKLHKEKSKVFTQSNIRIIILLPDYKKFIPEDFMFEFKKKWLIDIVIAETSDFGEDKVDDKHRIYIGGNGIHNIMFKINEFQLSKDYTDLLIEASTHGFTSNTIINDDEVIDLHFHKANIDFEYIFGSEDKIDRILFISKIILSLFNYFDAIGMNNISAQSYLPKSSISYLFQNKEISIIDIFHFFIHTQTIRNDNNFEIHTHGMEQVHLPDIRLYYDDDSNIEYNQMIVNSACIYNIEKNDVLKIGHTFQVTNDQEVYKIINVPENKEHPYGNYGAIQLERI